MLKVYCGMHYFLVMAAHVVLKHHFTMVEKTIKNVVIVVIWEWRPNEEKWDVGHQPFLVSLVKSHFQVVVC